MKKVICQYCKTKASLIDSKTIFGYRSYGMIYYCHKCGDYVGVHKKTNKPLGTLANPELSKKRVETHKVFDRLWKSMLNKNKYWDKIVINKNSWKVTQPLRDGDVVI